MTAGDGNESAQVSTIDKNVLFTGLPTMIHKRDFFDFIMSLQVPIRPRRSSLHRRMRREVPTGARGEAAQDHGGEGEAGERR